MPDRKAAVGDHLRLNCRKEARHCPTRHLWPTAVLAKLCELPPRQEKPFPYRIKGISPKRNRITTLPPRHRSLQGNPYWHIESHSKTGVENKTAHKGRGCWCSGGGGGRTDSMALLTPSGHENRLKISRHYVFARFRTRCPEGRNRVDHRSGPASTPAAH